MAGESLARHVQYTCRDQVFRPIVDVIRGSKARLSRAMVLQSRSEFESNTRSFLGRLDAKCKHKNMGERIAEQFKDTQTYATFFFALFDKNSIPRHRSNDRKAVAVIRGMVNKGIEGSRGLDRVQEEWMHVIAEDWSGIFDIPKGRFHWLHRFLAAHRRFSVAYLNMKTAYRDVKTELPVSFGTRSEELAKLHSRFLEHHMEDFLRSLEDVVHSNHYDWLTRLQVIRSILVTLDQLEGRQYKALWRASAALLCEASCDMKNRLRYHVGSVDCGRSGLCGPRHRDSLHLIHSKGQGRWHLDPGMEHTDRCGRDATMSLLFEFLDPLNCDRRKQWLLDGVQTIEHLRIQNRSWKKLKTCESVRRGPLGRVIGDTTIVLQLASLSHLRELRLAHNKLEEIDVGVFSRLSSLEHLSLEHNCLKHITRGMFEGLGRVQSLWLSHNSLETVEAKSFAGLSRLWELRLSHNSLEDLQAGVFEGLPELRSLMLSHNRLRNVRVGVLSGLPNLLELSLEHNQLSTLRTEAFKDVNLEIICLSGNPSLKRVESKLFEGGLRSLR